jgi:hypothetical protein
VVAQSADFQWCFEILGNRIWSEEHKFRHESSGSHCMRVFVSAVVAMIVICGATPPGLVWAADPKVEELKEAPSGLSPEVTAAINGTGYRIVGPKGAICDVWLAKEIPVVAGFKRTPAVQYPLAPGELFGAIRFPAGTKPTDFRGQELRTALYVLRYGQQPEDGNHLGTSETRDFLVGTPPKEDTDPKRIPDVQKLFALGAKSSGTPHPAIFLLMPPADKPAAAPKARHDEAKELVIFEANANGKGGSGAAMLPFSLVVVGKTAE